MARTRRRTVASMGMVAALAATAACGGTAADPTEQVAHGEESPGNAVVDWNAIALGTTAAASFDPPRETRNLAIVHGAIFDAVNSITGEFRPYGDGQPKAPSGASTEAAVATAAHDTLVALYPAQRDEVDEAYRAAMGKVAAGADKDAGVAAGRDAATRLLEERAADGADDPAAYEGGTAPGQWRPAPPDTKPALDPGWGGVTPFVLDRADQFRGPGPYALTSGEYARDFDEVKQAGAATSTVRTDDQTVAARFWAATAAQEWSQPARQLALTQHLGPGETARLFAHLNFAVADAAIGAWDMKYTYGQWRPISGIREAADDGNPATAPDPEWAPLLPTPPFPDYVCGHTMASGAAEAVLEQYFGTQPGGQLSLTSGALPGVTRHYPTFRAIGDEVVNARVWGGIHWRASCESGRAAGLKVGDFVVSHVLRPARH